MVQGYLTEFINQLDWWNLYPANEILAIQPGEEKYNHWISVVKSPDDNTIVAYIPEKSEVTLFNPKGYKYEAQWFNPVDGKYSKAKIVQYTDETAEKVNNDNGERMIVTIRTDVNWIKLKHDFENDMLIILKRK